MRQKLYANPFFIFFLVLPYGISVGFVSVTLPYLLTQKEFSVEEAGAIVAVGVSANVWRFFWGPVADLTLTLNRWYWIGVIACIATLLLLCLIPYNIKGATLLTVIVFISQVAATFVVLPVGGIMAHRIEEHKKGMAGGWYQAGNLGGVGLGGGVGLWVATHYNVWLAGVVLSIGIFLFALIILFIKDVENNYQQKSIGQELKTMGKDMLEMLRVPVSLFVIILLCMPIGTGAASNLWSAIANDWKVSADTVALVTGILSALVSAVGCIIGGWFADRWGVWWAYFGAGIICALVTVIMAALPYIPAVYIYGVLAYAFALGLINAAFSATALFAMGKKAASTKYSLLSSLANVPVVYMTSFDGWAHDHGGSKYMLVVEAIAAVVFVIICLPVLKRLNTKKLLDKQVDADIA
jgi:PAT family beta-lactamase induction signal transducer AmpG